MMPPVRHTQSHGTFINLTTTLTQLLTEVKLEPEVTAAAACWYVLAWWFEYHFS